MQLVEVTTKALEEQLITFPITLYKNDPCYIRPLDDDIRKVFDPERNKFFKHVTAIRWLLKDDSGKTIGRVAAFINESKARTFEQPTGGMGFFECINDKKA